MIKRQHAAQLTVSAKEKYTMMKLPSACKMNQRAGLLQQIAMSNTARVQTQNKTWTKISNILPSRDGSRTSFKQRAVIIQHAEKSATRVHMLNLEAKFFFATLACSDDCCLCWREPVASEISLDWLLR